MSFLPSVIRAEYRGGYRIHVTFNDNSEKTINFREWLEGPVFEPLKAPNRFRKFLPRRWHGRVAERRRHRSRDSLRVSRAGDAA